MYQELYLISSAVFLFFLDIFFIQFFSQQCLYFLYIFALGLLPRNYSWLLTLFIFILLAAESIIAHTTLGTHFLITTISYMCALYLINTVASTRWLLALVFFIFLILSSYANILSLKKSWLCHPCTSLKFIGNFIILYFSLKWLSAVKRGNRF